MTGASPQSEGNRLGRSGWRGTQPLVGCGFVVLAILLGGASAAGILANAALQLVAVLLIGFVLLGRSRRPVSEAQRQLIWLLSLFALLHLLQLVPLPPFVWTSLAGRGYVAEGLGALGVDRPWMPLSLDPALTLSSALALLVPAAAIAATCSWRRDNARFLVIGLLLASGLAMLVGAAQVARGGPYVYDATNTDSAVGFFANANHFGTLLCVIMPLTAALVSRSPGSSGRIPRSFRLTILGGVIILALVGIVLTRSFAAVALSMLSITSSLVIAFPAIRGRLRLILLAGVAVVTLAALLAVMLSSSDGLLNSELNTGLMSRPGIWRVTVAAIRQFGAVGAGFGAFQEVFHLFENPDLVSDIYANHAHNDLLELILVGGIPAVLLLIVFLIWFARRLVSVWLTERDTDPLAQAASAAALIVLLHSLVDYPLRTASIAAVFGLCLAIMARDTKREAELRSGVNRSNRHLAA